MAPKLPMDVRMLVADAESQAKKHGHGEVTPLHLVAAVAARGLVKDRVPAELASAINQQLQAIEADYASPTLSAETKKILADVAATPDPMQTLLVHVVGLAAEVVEPGKPGEPERPVEAPGSKAESPLVRGDDRAEAPDSDGHAAEKSGRVQAGEPRELTPAQRQLVEQAATVPLSVGRGAIVHRLVAMLGAREPQPVLLVGDPGSGRTSVAQALAAVLVGPGYRGPLSGAAVYVTNTSSLLAQRNWSALTPLATSGVLVIDDADVLMRLGGAIDYVSLAAMRALVAGPGTRIVLMLSSANLDRFRAADPEFMTQLEICRVPALDAQEVLEIAREEAKALAEHHGVVIPIDVVAAAAMPRRMSDTQSHPALAVRRLDRAGAAAKLRADLTARAGDLGSEVPAQQYVAFDADRARVALGAHVIGQDQAIRHVTDRLSVTRTALDLRPERPDGVFLFAGPTGTGKTALALQLGREIYGSSEAVIRLDMSEFAEPHTVSKLFGSPPGYVGSTDPDSWLTTRIRMRPQCVLLLDEIEKAHPSVWNAFLQVFDAGTLSDSLGNRADFAEVVVILTSNIGAEAFAQKVATGFLEDGSQDDADSAEVLAELRRRMRPELLNRLDGTVVFRPLSQEVIREIAAVNLAQAILRLEDRGWQISVTDDVEDLLVERGFSREYGARPLLRAVEDLILRPLAGLPTGRYLLAVEGASTVVLDPHD
ncbi:MAG: AAA family ATPase [Candidatus Nanopelagicales bacterium]